jgi:hypothetical protein
MEIKLIDFMLEKKVRKSLIETKERKEKLLIEETLIKNRLSIILEGVNSDKEFKSLSEKKQLRISSKFIQELSYLQETKLINEQNLGSLMQSLFGGWFGNLTQTIFEPMFSKILTPLFGEGFFTDFLTSYLTSRPSDVIKSFNDCKLMTNLISKGISESIVMQIQKNTSLTDPGYNFIRNTIGDVLSGTEFITKIEDGLESKVCNVLNEFSGNAEKVVNKLKSGLTD